jgi:hypothetical protein
MYASWGKSQTESAGGRPDPGQAYSAGRVVKTSLERAARGVLVNSIPDQYSLNESSACDRAVPFYEEHDVALLWSDP